MKVIDWDFRIDTDLLSLSVIPGNDTRFYLQHQGKDIALLCPPSTRFNETGRQQWLHRVLVEVLRKKAKIILPDKVRELANQYGFRYNAVHIKAMRTRWGSCSSLGNINLSAYLMMLPSIYIDYVILHELCHTEEMNHGPRFWARLNEITDGKAQQLRKELRNYPL